MEYLTVLHCMGKLELAFKGDRDLATFLLQEGVISKDTYDDVMNPRSTLTTVQKAGELLRELMDAIKMNCQKYHSFMGRFRENPRAYKDIVDILDEEFLKLNGKYAEISEMGN